MIKKVPSLTLLICDRCKRDGEQYASGAFDYGGLHIRAAEFWGKSPQGDVGGAHINIDLCAKCSTQFMNWVHGRDGLDPDPGGQEMNKITPSGSRE